MIKTDHINFFMINQHYNITTWALNKYLKTLFFGIYEEMSELEYSLKLIIKYAKSYFINKSSINEIHCIDLEKAENMPDQCIDLSQLKGSNNDLKTLVPSMLPDGVYHVQNGIISAHPEIFKVKMLAKKNVKTISTMSSSNYDNSDNSSNIGSNYFKVPNSRIYERDIMTECGEDRAQEISEQLKNLIDEEKELNNRSKDDEWMNTSINKQDYMNECIKLIRDSPFLLKRSFLCSKEHERTKEIEQERDYCFSLQGLKSLFNDEDDMQDSSPAMSDAHGCKLSPYKSLNEQIYGDILSISSDSKHQQFVDDMEVIENNSINEDVMNYLNNEHHERSSCMSQSSYMEDFDADYNLYYSNKNLDYGISI